MNKQTNKPRAPSANKKVSDRKVMGLTPYVFQYRLILQHCYHFDESPLVALLIHANSTSTLVRVFLRYFTYAQLQIHRCAKYFSECVYNRQDGHRAVVKRALFALSRKQNSWGKWSRRAKLNLPTLLKRALEMTREEVFKESQAAERRALFGRFTRSFNKAAELIARSSLLYFHRTL